ncbi:acyl carrier protein [Nocardia harenae]|uniref:acyl carrier protein n=1 Tax=Nocardia harenae TaxID=358707 RepID=UPI0008323C18|nr:acyl carrier protein [Nocardia harenae]
MRAGVPEGRAARRAAFTAAAVAAITALLPADAGPVSTTAPFTELGLNSTQLARLTGELEEALGVAIPLVALYDHASIEQLVEHLTA